MDCKLNATSENDVEVILPAGTDFVRTLYPEAKCRAILAASVKAEKSAQFDGFIEVNGGEIFISGSTTASKAKAEKVTDEAKEVKPKATKAKTTNTKKKA